jgi:flavin-dependent dehydrogenase
MTTECDFLVIGGGPAGCTAAATLAMRGRDVVLLEKERHPRFHIGESLLPMNTAIFERLGITDQVAALGVHKPGAEFVSDAVGKAVKFDFSDALENEYTYSWQVTRAPFDALLFRTATERGAKTQQEIKVTSVTFGRPGERARVEAVGPDGQTQVFLPRFVLDASGRDTFLGGRIRKKEANKRNNTAALYAHFRGVERRAGNDEGYITVHLAEDGWFWVIPLPDGITSVGFVGNQAAFKGRRGSPKDLFLQRIQESPTVSARMREAEMVSDVTSTGNYSYYCDRSYGDGYIMIGDAFAFLDPVFSSGVLLAMTTGERGAGVAETWLENPARGKAEAARMEKDVRWAMARLSWLIYRINTPALRMLFMSPGNRWRVRDGLISLLGGNLSRSRGLVVPITAFKLIYYTAAGLLRSGLLKPNQSLDRPAPAE